MDKRSVYVELAQEFVELAEANVGIYCCYNYNNEEQNKNGCFDKDCDECKKQYFDEMYKDKISKYDNAN